ncbi:hypothetical protein C0993_004377 [Termitomyces sp. T159_Od127]|nr:hypothetical protein C0993_004377 [Termitomyces sp. T159_Od127]
MSITRLLRDWSFTQVGGGAGTQNGEWLPTSGFPTTVHVELLKLKRIPDPFIGLNEWDVQWVGESDWAFKSTFTVTEEEYNSPHVDLVFDGLDTFARVDLNGKTILEANNQFIAYRVAVKESLKIGANDLVLTFESAFLKGRDIEKQHTKLGLWNGDSSRLHVRKAQYNVTPERYRAWLQLMIDGNQNMVRVWGGGIYENDVFYDICDELGRKINAFTCSDGSLTCDYAVLVWQDFMFGCGQYPAYESFLKSVEVEVDQNVKRLRHHPSIVIFAGNNEDYQIAEQLGLELDYNDETSDFRKTNFPARHIYEVTLPAAVKRNCDIHYHRASPYSGHGRPTTDRTFGDIHQWNVWHGSQEPWHNWDILSGRFVSEFGMQGYPNIRTVDYWLGGDKSERFPQSRTNNNHNKADGFERRLEVWFKARVTGTFSNPSQLYLMENFKHSFEMESYVYYTQVMQAETLASAYRLWRRNWGGKGREYTAGALVWQINDCWPVTSWAIVDYFLRPKPAFFTIARELRPFTVGMTRKDHKVFEDDRHADRFTIETKLEIWGTNSTLIQKKAKLEVTTFDLHSDWRTTTSVDVVLATNASTELFKGSLPGQPIRIKNSEVPRVLIVSARLIDENGQILSRYSNWPEPFKFIKFPTREELGLKITVSADGESVLLSTNKPVKGIVLDVEGHDVKWSDQAIDLIPDDPQIIKATGLNGREIKVRYLGDGTA